jgi:carboxypeptidase family protein
MSTLKPSRFTVCGSSVTVLVATILLALSTSLLAQTTISTGSIQGTVIDPSNAVVGDAKVSITNKATGQVLSTTTSSAGAYTSGALIPGDYVVRVEAKGFRTVDLPVTVQVGVTSSGSVRLQVGEASQVVEVQGQEIRVNTEQAAIQGVLSTQQIDSLPINGRNFLDLAQLEPGVQIQDGGNFDPTKNGFSSISFGGRFGRTARIEVDGVDISDETVGTTTQNIPQEAIQEFQIGQSMLDLSTELTSSGSVNVVTRSGTNSFHGDAFYLFRDASIAANLPGDTPFQRNQYGGRIGGPILKDKMFFFIAGERLKQDLIAPVIMPAPFDALDGSFNSPFKESQIMGKLDYQVGKSGRAFYRFSFDANRNVAGFIPNAFQPFANNDHTPSHVGGVDFNTGSYTHSIRAGYSKFRNGITDAVTGSSIFNPAPTLELAIGNDPFCLTPGFNDFCSGINFLAPQNTFQTNHQVKYDGSKTVHAHILRYGFGFNHVQGGGFAKFLGSAPAVNSVSDPTLAANLFPGGAGNPLNYPAQTVVLANGQGFASEKKVFNQPGGGLGPDNRFSFYIGDSWKLKPNFTITGGVRYVRDTGRTDSDVAPAPCSQLDPRLGGILQAAGTPCTRNILDLWGNGLGDRVHQPNTNFAPQLGIAWDPNHNGKTVVRAGIGLFFENSPWNNNLFDRPPRLSQGLFLGFAFACAGGAAQTVSLPSGGSVTPTFCNQPIGSVESDIAALQAQFQASTAAAGPAVNGTFIGNTLTSAQTATSTSMFAPDYKTSRSVQMNIGIQREMWRGAVLSVDYLRNVATHTLLAVDVNHVGDARFLNVANALAAINATVTAAGCPAATSAGASSQAAINCYLGVNNLANITDFAANGLDSGVSFCGGLTCNVSRFDPSNPSATIPLPAFGGVNPNLGPNEMLFPIGRSVYNGLQMSLKQNLSNPIRGVKNMTFQFSYSLSRYVSTARDSDFINDAYDYARPTRFIGPNGLDRKHQISIGGTYDLPFSTRLSIISHFYSPLPRDLNLPSTGLPGEIFRIDVTGDGTGSNAAFGSSSTFSSGDLVPGTNIGSFGRDLSAGGLNKLITNYNNNFAGTVTPAGQALIDAQLFTSAQLVTLNGVQQPIALAPSGQVNLGWLRALDLKASWPIKIKETLTVEPGVSLYNLFNFANFDGPNNLLSGVLDGSVGSLNGTTAADRSSNRIGVGSGAFGLGSPRVVEFGLRITF